MVINNDLISNFHGLFGGRELESMMPCSLVLLFLFFFNWPFDGCDIGAKQSRKVWNA